MKKRPVNLGRTDENIAEQYPNIFEGLQKDAAQNAWDAKLTKKGKGWKLIFRYIPDRGSLVFEDFGTTGMNEKKWIEYQSLWDTTKAEEDTLGARGQGKFLFHYFSQTKLVLTETIDKEGKYRFSWGTAEEWDEEGKNLQDFILGARILDHQGTRIWIMNVKKELLEELLDYRVFMKYISSTWWEIIRNWNAVFIVNFDGVDRQVTLPELPRVKKEKTFINEKIRNIGKIRNLVLRYCEDEVPKEWREISIQRGGMSVLRLLIVAEESIKNKIYGYCNFDNSLEIELKKCEFPNHFGFRPKKAWNHVREYIRHKVDDFLLEITPKKEKIEVSADVLEKAVKLVNNLVGEYIPELLSGPEIPPPPPSTQPPPPVRIGVFRPNQRKFEYNETLLIDCEVVNETEEDRNLSLQIVVKHKDGIVKYKSRYNLDIAAKTRKKIDLPLIDFNEGEDRPGEYRGKATLTDRSAKEEIHKREFTFYLHEEPPVPPPGPARGKAFITAFQFLRGKKPDGSMQYFAKWKSLPITDKGVIWVVGDHPDFIRVREVATSKRTRNREILLYCAKCGIDEAFGKLLELRYADNRLNPDEIKRVKNICDEMIYEGVVRTA